MDPNQGNANQNNNSKVDMLQPVEQSPTDLELIMGLTSSTDPAQTATPLFGSALDFSNDGVAIMNSNNSNFAQAMDRSDMIQIDDAETVPTKPQMPTSEQTVDGQDLTTASKPRGPSDLISQQSAQARAGKGPSTSEPLQNPLVQRQLEIPTQKPQNEAQQNYVDVLDEDNDVEEILGFNTVLQEYQRKSLAGENTNEDEIVFKRQHTAHQNKLLKIKDDHERIMEDNGHQWDDRRDLPASMDRRGLNEESLESIEDDSYPYASMNSGMREGLEVFTNTELDDLPAAIFQTSNSKKPGITEQILNGKNKKGPTSATPGHGKIGKTRAPTSHQIFKKDRNHLKLFNPANLLRTDVFRDVTENADRAAHQPTFSATTKKEALKELVSSIPTELQSIAKIDKAQISKATTSFTPRGSCSADGDGGWKVRGMKSSLSHYQMLAVSFMRQRETGSELPKGGIHADAMGLGKTVMMLANIVNGLRKAPHQTTLIIAPPSLIIQWMNEIEKHTVDEIFKRVCHFQGGSSYDGSQLKMKHMVTDLLDKDIVFATYNEVRNSYPKWSPPATCTTVEQKAAWWEQYYNEKKGILHRIPFHRIVLDEAQAIKNPFSATSIACRALEGQYRWAMSGTPVQNSIAEFYAYFRFLQVPKTGSLRIFKSNFCTDDEKGAERLHFLLRQFMIRRGHNDELFGAKLLDIPKPKKSDYACHFSDIEREIYEVVRRRVIKRINGFLKAGQIEKKYSHMMSMQLLLRQLVSHPLLVQNALQIILEPEDFDKLERITQKNVLAQSSQEAQLKNLRILLDTAREKGFNALSAAKTEKNPPADNTSRPVRHELGMSSTQGTNLRNISAGGAYGIKNNFQEYLTDIRSNSKYDKVQDMTVCPQCFEVPLVPYVTSCKHIYCYDCIMTLLTTGRESDEKEAYCLKCDSVLRGLPEQKFSTKIKPSDAHGSPISTEATSTPQKKLREAQAAVDKWIDSKGNMLPSAKTLAIKAQILNWFQEEPGVKIIIYSQFLAMICIFAKICAIEKWTCIQFTGALSIEARAKAIEQFEQKDGPSIMICSLRAGGVGLNLTMATRVVMVDLWWNTAVEDQAFCRTFRRGQDRETVLARFVVQDSIETAILAMQERKDKEIGEVMDNEAKAKKKLTTKELLSLFGPLGKDEHGNEFILVDDARKNARPPRIVVVDDDDDIEMGDEI